MALVTRRYRWDGPDLNRLRSMTDPAAILPQTTYAVFVDVTFDNAVADAAAVDAAMREQGFVFDATTADDVPFFAFRSPDGTLKRVQVDNGGIQLAPAGYVNGLGLSFATVSQAQIAAGQARDSTNAFTILLGAPVTVDLTVLAANGRDTGAEAASTWYFVYVIGDSTGVNATAGLLSTNSVAPVLPAGYDKFRRVGSVRNNAASDIIEFIQQATGNLRTYNYLDAVANRQILTAGTAIARTNVAAGAFVPSTTRFGRFEVRTSVGVGSLFFAGSAGDDIRTLPGLDQFDDLMPTDGAQQIAYQNLLILGSTDIWVTGYNEVI